MRVPLVLKAADPPEILPMVVLDLSRLIYAALNRTPAGIPRVELAYAEYFAVSYPGPVRFAVQDAIGRLRLLDNHHAMTFVAAIARYWRQDVGSNKAYFRLVLRHFYIHAILLLRPGNDLLRFVSRPRGKCVYIIASQLHLERSVAIARLCSTGNLKLVYFVHDIIPSLLPEYFPPAEESRNRRRMETAATLANLIVVNSQATADAFHAEFGQKKIAGSMVVIPLGVRPSSSVEIIASSSDHSYFVIAGTIEPRKNHLLLLNLWRQLRAELGNATPQLILVGSRGWENENVVDMLERSVALRGFVQEAGRLSDFHLDRLLSGARALVLPSFAEGYGLPVAEALARGVPVLCSDIAAFREVGGDVPEYLDPLDGPAWRSAVLDYAKPTSTRRSKQLERLSRWSAPSWDRHFAKLNRALHVLLEQSK